ncbi:MAG: hypothetical protein ACR2HZ_11955 [Gemmatimonadaceae bacterium]|jgi:hypothetical protein
MTDILKAPGSATATVTGDTERQLDDPPENLFSMLAARARGHRPAHLWGAALFGAADAAFILIAYPAAWSLACASVALCTFGVWGLADDALLGDPYREPAPVSRVVVRAVRAVALGIGVLAASAAAFGLMAAALGSLTL